jgi:hypothetical protein
VAELVCGRRIVQRVIVAVQVRDDLARGKVLRQLETATLPFGMF